MEVIFRIIAYVIMLAVNGVMYYFLHSHFYFTLLVLMLVAPVVSTIVNIYVWKNLQVELESVAVAKQGEENFSYIKIINKTPFPCLDARITFTVSNDFFKSEGRKTISVPIRAIKGNEIELPLLFVYPGNIILKLENIRIKDLMGFFWLKKNLDKKSEITVYPELISDVNAENVDLNQGVLESEESTKRGNDFSDVQEIREYIPGDKLMSIHWKLSAKRDILMVKDRVSMSDKQMAIVPELCGFYKETLNIIVATTYTLIHQLIQSGTTVRLLYWSMERYEYEEVRIDYLDELNQAFNRMFYEKTYDTYDEAASHMMDVHPEMKAYVHVTLSDGRVGPQIRDNG